MSAYSKRAEDRVPNDKIREAVLASGMSINEIARVVGRNESQIRRSLGITHTARTGEPGYTNKRINYHLAVAIARAIDVYPVDVDL